MMDIAVARAMVNFVERTAVESSPDDEAATGKAVRVGLWHWLQGMVARRADVGPSA